MSAPKKTKPKPWYPKLFPKQVEIFNCYKRFLLVSGPRLSGKCVDAETLIRSDNGLCRINKFAKEISPGDQININRPLKSFNGTTFESDKASIFYRDKCTDGYRIDLNWGYSISTSPWHPVWCCISGVFSYQKTETLKQLIDSGTAVYVPVIADNFEWQCPFKIVSYKRLYKSKDMLAAAHERIRQATKKLGSKASWNSIARLSGTHYRSVKSFFSGLKPILIEQTTITEDIGYLLGVLVGDGNISKSHDPNISISFSSIDMQIVDKCRQILDSEFNATLRQADSICDWIINNSNKLRSLLTFLGMNKLAHEKSIPDVIIESPKTVLKAFIQGLFDTDGTVDKFGHVSFCSCSKPLASQVHQLLLVFGVSARLRFKPNAKRGAWLVDIDSDSEIFRKHIGFRLTRKQTRSFGLRRRFGKNHTFPPCIVQRIKFLYSNKTVKMTRKEWHTGIAKQWSNYAAGKYGINSDRLSKLLTFIGAENDPVIASYQITPNCFWRKIESITPSKVDLYDIYVDKNHSFIGNGLINHNTIGVVHRVTRHLWETPHAVVGVFSKILRTAKDTGVWQDFLKIVLPEWMGRTIDADGNETYVPVLYNQYGQPFEFLTKDSNGVPGPKSDSVTRSMFFTVRNRWGGASKLMLFSLDNENEATARLKGTRFSMIYVPELSEFETDVMYKHGSQQLRIGAFKDQQWIADTNPSHEGEDSWIWKFWYRDRIQVDYPEPLVQKEIGLIEVFLHDNPSLDPFALASLRQAYGKDPSEFERNIHGLWVKGSGKIRKVFADIFNEKIHVIPDYIDVNLTSDLFTGWDLGEVNNAVVMVEKRIIIRAGKEVVIWLVFEEIISIDAPISIRTFVDMYMDSLQKIEQFYGKKLLFRTHYSDDSAINKYRPGSDSYDYLTVREITNGEVELEGVYKPDGSIAARVRLIRQLLFENRLFFGSNCEDCIGAMKNMMSGDNNKPISKNSRYKHSLDAFSYIIFAESIADMDLAGQPKSRGDKLISV